MGRKPAGAMSSATIMNEGNLVGDMAEMMSNAYDEVNEMHNKAQSPPIKKTNEKVEVNDLSNDSKIKKIKEDIVKSLTKSGFKFIYNEVSNKLEFTKNGHVVKIAIK